MFNVFKGYKVDDYATFCAYILKKRDHYDEGGVLSMDTLMTFSKNNFKALKADGLWTAPTSDEKRIIYLTAQVQYMSVSATTLKVEKLTQVPPVVDGERARNNERDRLRSICQKIPPLAVGETSKVDENKKYNLCPKHKARCMHLPPTSTSQRQQHLRLSLMTPTSFVRQQLWQTYFSMTLKNYL